MHAYTFICMQPRLAVLMVLSGSPEKAIAVLGVECSTFVQINRGTSKRSEVLPWGDLEVESVSEANEATSRTMLSFFGGLRSSSRTKFG